MAAKIGRVHGDYAKDVCDSGEPAKKYLYDSPGQDKKKFANDEQKASVKAYSGMENTKQKLSQKINTPMDSGEGKGRQGAEGGSTTRDQSPKAPRAYPYTDKMKAPKRGAM